METALALIAGLGLAGGITAAVVAASMIRHRRALPGWQRAADALGGKLQRTLSSLRIETLVAGRPLTVKTHEVRTGRTTTIHTTAATVARHPDDVAAGAPMPAPIPGAWLAAWQDAEVRARLADLPRPPLVGEALPSETTRGLVGDGDELVAMARRVLAGPEAEERRVEAWTEAARALGLDVRAAYLLEHEVRGCRVRVVADLASAAVVVRAVGVAHGAADRVSILERGAAADDSLVPVSLGLPAHYQAHAADPERAAARVTETARAALATAAPTSVIAEQQHATVVVPGLDPAPERWRAAIALAVELTAAPSDGAFR